MCKAGIAGDNAPCAVFARMRSSLFGALCIGTGPGGHVHRDMTSIIRCRTVVAYRQRHVIYIASEPPPPPPTTPRRLPTVQTVVGPKKIPQFIDTVDDFPLVWVLQILRCCCGEDIRALTVR